MPPMVAIAHDTHVSASRVVIEGRTVLMRVRMFRDDLDSALVLHHKQPSARVMRTPVGDSLVLSYLRQRVGLRADGVALTPRLADAGGEDDPSGQPVWWVLLEYQAPRAIGTLALRQQVLMEVFGRQQNLVTALRTADGARASLYFTSGSDAEQVVRLSK